MSTPLISTTPGHGRISASCTLRGLHSHQSTLPISTTPGHGRISAPCTLCGLPVTSLHRPFLQHPNMGLSISYDYITRVRFGQIKEETRPFPHSVSFPFLLVSSSSPPHSPPPTPRTPPHPSWEIGVRRINQTNYHFECQACPWKQYSGLQARTK